MMAVFPSLEEAKAWHESPAYKEACKHRFQGGDFRCILVEGVDWASVESPVTGDQT